MALVAHLKLDPSQYEAAQKRVRIANRKTSETGREVTGGVRAMRVGMVAFGAAAAAAGAAVAASVISIGREFERLRTQLETVTGSRGAAGQAFSEILDFAKATPFQVNNITESFIRLKAVGIEPTLELLTSAGDIAAANGRDILQFSEAIVGAVTGEMERLKQFGIVARQQGDQVTFIFKGVETTVKKNSEEIVNALLKIGETEFAGGMERQTRTLDGRLSNLADAWGEFADTVFSSGLGTVLGEIALAATKAVNALTALTKGVGGLAGAFAIIQSSVADVVAGITDTFAKLLEMLSKIADLPGGQALLGLPSPQELQKTAASVRAVATGISIYADIRKADAIRLINKAMRETGEAAKAVKKPVVNAAAALAKLVEKSKGLDELSPRFQKLRDMLKDIEELVPSELLPASSFNDLDRLIETARERREIAFDIGTAAERVAIIEQKSFEIQQDLKLTEEQRLRLLAQQLNLVEQQRAAISDVVGLVSSAFASFGGSAGNIGSLAAQLFAGFKDAGPVLKDLKSSYQELTELQSSGTASTEQLSAATSGLISSAANAAGAIISLAKTLTALLHETGIADPAGVGAFGGRTAGDASAEGGAIGAAAGTIAGGIIGGVVGSLTGPLGAAIGASLGAALGGAVGELLGTVVGSFIKHGADRVFLTIQADAGGDLALEFIRRDGKLTQVGQDLGDALIAGMESIIDTLGGRLVGFAGVNFQIVAGEKIAVLFADLQREFEATEEGFREALEFAIVNALSRSEVSGLSPTVKAALQTFAGETVEQLEAHLADALKIDNLGLEQIAVDLKAQVDELNRLLIRAFEDFGTGAENVLLGPGGIAATIQNAYNAAFGIEVDIEAQTRANIAAVEAQVLAETAHLLALKASIEAQALAAQTTANRAQIDVDVSRLTIDAVSASSRAHIGYAGVIAATGQVVAETASASAQALAAIDEALAILSGFDFSDAAIRDAINRARNAARGAGGGGGGSSAESRAAAREANRMEIERLRLITEGATEAELAAFQFARQMRELEESLREAGASSEDIATRLALEEEARAQAAAAAFDTAMEPIRELVASIGESDFETRLRQIAELRAEELALLDGQVVRMEDYNAILAANAERLRELGEDVMDSLGGSARETRQEIQSLAERFRFARKHAHQLGISSEELGEVFAEISQSELLNIGQFLAQALGDEEALADFRRLEFQIELENMRLRFELLVAEGLLLDEQVERLSGLFDAVEENMGDILDGFDQAASSVSSAAASLAASSAAPGGIFDDAAAFVASLQAQLSQAQGVQSPIASLIAEMDSLRDQILGMIPALQGAGFEVGEVLAIVDQLQAARLANLFEQANQGIMSVIESLTTGVQSGRSPLARFSELQARAAALQAQISGGTLEEQLAARQALGDLLPDLLALGPQALGAGFTTFRDQLLADLQGIAGFDPATGSNPLEPLPDLQRTTNTHLEGVNERLDQLATLLDFSSGRRSEEHRQAQQTRLDGLRDKAARPLERQEAANIA